RGAQDRVPRARPVRAPGGRRSRDDARVPDRRERRDGDLAHADHRHPAAVHLTRRQLARVDLFRSRSASVDLDAARRGPLGPALTLVYFSSNGDDREQYAYPSTKRAGGWCEPVSRERRTRPGAARVTRTVALADVTPRYRRARVESVGVFCAVGDN